MKNPLPLFLLLGSLSPLLQAVTLNVPASYATIQKALDTANNGDTVLVAPGTYKEYNLAFRGKAVSLKSSAGAAATIIDGQKLSYVFDLEFNEGRGSLVEGFTIQNGFKADNRPGGMYLRGASPTVRNNVFRNNLSGTPDGMLGTGGAICILAGITGVISNPLITGNTFTSNISEIDGGAIYLYNSVADITFNTFTSNVARRVADNSRGSGAAIMANRTPGTAVLNISNNIFTGNTCKFAGGAISIFGMAASIKNNTFTNNNGGRYGGGVHVETQAAYGTYTYTITGNAFTGNKATDVGGAIHTFMEKTASTVLIQGNSIVNNTCLDPTATSATSPKVGKGAGMGCYDGVGQMTITNNIVADNRADSFAGILVTTAPVIVTQNQLTDNHARFGNPGLYLSLNKSVRVSSNILSGNYVESQSDAVFVAGAFSLSGSMGNPSIVSNNIFENNTGTQCGAFSCGGSLPILLQNNTFVNNHTNRSFGGTIYLDNDVTVQNNIFQGDTYACRVVGTRTIHMQNNDFSNNTSGLVQFPPTNYYNITQLNGATFADNNLNVTPGFADQAGGNYHLLKTSPMVDKGLAITNTLDFENDPRPRGAAMDIGADELAVDRAVLAKEPLFYLDRNGDFVYNTGDPTVSYGLAGDVPLFGDWNGDGIDSIGYRRGNFYYLRNSNTPGAADIVYSYGAATSKTVVGDWNGDGIDTPCVQSGGQFILRNTNLPSDVSTISFVFGGRGDQFSVGDFDGDGIDTICIKRGNRYYLRNTNTSVANDIAFNFGSGNELPIFGDWNGAGVETIGTYDAATGLFNRRYSNTTGSPESTSTFGLTGGIPMQGIF